MSNALWHNEKGHVVKKDFNIVLSKHTCSKDVIT